MDGTMRQTDALLGDVAERVAVGTLNRPELRNALRANELDGNRAAIIDRGREQAGSGAP
jgi:hypothetical protein